MERRNEESGMFRGEPTGWLAAIGVLGVYSVLFFGGNAVRSAVDGHWTVAGLLLLGALVGLAYSIGVMEEARRRRKEAKRLKAEDELRRMRLARRRERQTAQHGNERACVG